MIFTIQYKDESFNAEYNNGLLILNAQDYFDEANSALKPLTKFQV